MEKTGCLRFRSFPCVSIVGKKGAQKFEIGRGKKETLSTPEKQVPLVWRRLKAVAEIKKGSGRLYQRLSLREISRRAG